MKATGLTMKETKLAQETLGWDREGLRWNWGMDRNREPLH